jgi:anti-sigma regulatory factor (Ser/Thr protein kinase)
MKDLSLHILDIIENSVNAGAKNIEISIKENLKDDVLILSIKDDGKGIKKDLLDKVTDPFVTTNINKKTGLGIPLLKQASDAANGKFSIESNYGYGTKITASFQNSHIDRKPIGDLVETFISAILFAPQADLIFRYKMNGNNVTIKTKELKKQIGVDTLTDTNILKELKELLNKKLREYFPAEKELQG